MMSEKCVLGSVGRHGQLWCNVSASQPNDNELSSIFYWSIWNRSETLKQIANIVCNSGGWRTVNHMKTDEYVKCDRHIFSLSKFFIISNSMTFMVRSVGSFVKRIQDCLVQALKYDVRAS